MDKACGHLWTVCIIAACLCICRIEGAEARQGNDYFGPKDKEAQTELANVEKHHLSQDTFYKRFGNKEYNYAMEDLKFVLRYFPNHPKALSLMEMVGKMMKNQLLPMPYYKSALDLYPQHAITHLQFGMYLLEIHQVNSAIDSLKRALELNPKLAPAHAWLAKAYSMGGQKELARESSNRARELGYKGDLP